MTNVILFLVTDQVLVLIIIATVPTAIRNTKAKWIIDRPPPLPPSDSVSNSLEECAKPPFFTVVFVFYMPLAGLRF